MTHVTHVTDPDAYQRATDATIAAEAEWFEASLDLLEAVYAEGALKQTVPIAVEAGVTDELFADDHLVLWRVAIVASQHDLSDAGLRNFIRAALQREYFFDASEIAANRTSAHWSRPKIDALLAAMYVSPVYIRHRASTLIVIVRRQRAAREHFDHATRLLAGEATP